jgi:hypothetical protein
MIIDFLTQSSYSVLLQGPLICTVELHNKETNEIVATAADITLGHVLITRLNLHLGDAA